MGAPSHPPLHEAPDDDLVQRARAGEREAFAEIYRRYHAVVYRFARMMSGSEAIGEDVTQETFTVLLRDLHLLPAAAAAAALTVVALPRGPAGPFSDDGAPPAETDHTADVPVAAPARETSSGERIATSREREIMLPERSGPRAVTGYVIVPEPLVDRAALHVVRVRTSRAVLATLGLPIVTPDADGLVDLEMLVGDDGVTQSIRRAAFVAEQAETETGVEQ